jgi:hypothetical protein
MDERISVSVHRQKQKIDEMVRDAIKDLQVKISENLDTVELKSRLYQDQVRQLID